MQRPEVFHRDHCFEYPKNPDKIKPSKQILAKFFPPPKIPESKISTPPKYFDRPCHSKSVVPVGFEQAWSHTVNKWVSIRSHRP